VTTRPPDQLPASPAAEDQAVEWHVRLMSDRASEADWLGFEAWLDAAPENPAAYARVEALWQDLEPAAGGGAEIRRLAPKRVRRPLAWAWPVGIAASIALAVAVSRPLWAPQTPAPTIYETAKGATREIALADGTRIRLNSGSHIAVALGPRERHVSMTDAEVAFDVAKDPDRPFVIDAGDRQIRVVGTEFDVLRHAGRVTVAVRRGIVEVRPGGADATAPPVARLVRGQSLQHREGGMDLVSSVDPNWAFAWTAGDLIYEDARLGDVAVDLSRYLASPIVVAPEAQDLRLTAVIKIDSEDAMVRRLAGFLPVAAVREGGVYRLGLRSKRH
jgi:transmembrane sensor